LGRQERIKMVYYSVVVPCYNEEKNVNLIYGALKKVMTALGKEYELVFVDDGSKDATFRNLLALHQKDGRVRIVKMRKNFGQTAAMDAGFRNAQGEIVISLDADLQNDPEDIPRLLAKQKEGYDVVVGWRFDRKDDFSKTFFSGIANLARRMLVRDGIHDSGCSLKVYKKECFENLDLYGEMHRYIPALLQWKGFKVTEIKVRHHKRKFGKTKYSVSRLFRGFLDLLVVSFWQKYSLRPIHLFGGLGIISSLVGGILGIYLIIMRLFFGMALGNKQTPLLAVLLVVIGIQFFLTGLMADIMIKNYYKDKTTYNIEKII
jgi:glycosyltransferase involved in cell wall biosynthesis